MDPVIILSPHLDDAVLSCGQFMVGRPDVIVVTVFAGYPKDGEQQTGYDAACGFASAEQAVSHRREEDVIAVHHVLAGGVMHLEFADGQYGDPFDFRDAIAQVREVIASIKPEFVLAPLGIMHPDHARTTTVAIKAVDAGRLWFYEELPGRVLWPDGLGYRRSTILAELVQAGTQNPVLVPDFIGTGDVEVKETACKAYESQYATVCALESGAGGRALYVNERYWKVQW